MVEANGTEVAVKIGYFNSLNFSPEKLPPKLPPQFAYIEGDVIATLISDIPQKRDERIIFCRARQYIPSPWRFRGEALKQSDERHQLVRFYLCAQVSPRRHHT